jgi:MFS family permease
MAVPVSHARPAPSKATAYYVLGLFTVIYAFANLDRNVINLALGSIKKDLQISDTLIGLIAGLGFSGAQLLFGLPLARWSDRSDRRVIITLSVGLWSLMTMFCGFARSALTFGLGRVAVGIGEATGPAFHSVLSDLFEKNERGRAIAIYALGVSLSVLIGYPLMGQAIQHFGWRAAFVIAGAPGMLLALLVLISFRDPRQVGAGSSHAIEAIPPLALVSRTIGRQKSYLLVIAGFCVGGFGSAGFNVWGPTFLARVHGLTPAQIGASVGLISGLAGLAGGLSGGISVDAMSRRFGDQWKIIPFAITATLMGPTILLTVFTPFLPLSLAGMGAISFLSAFQFAPIIAVIQSVMPARMRALASSINGFSAALVSIGLGPLYIGMVNDHLAHRYGPVVIRYSLASVALFCLLGAGCFWAASRRVARDIAHAEAIDAGQPASL